MLPVSLDRSEDEDHVADETNAPATAGSQARLARGPVRSATPCGKAPVHVWPLYRESM